MSRAPLPNFPRPTEAYDARNEAEFRHSVERAVQEAIAFVQQQRVASVTLGATENDYDAGSVVTALRVTANGAGTSLTGMASGRDGRRVLVVNVSANNLTLVNQSASSTAGNRFLAETGADVVLGQNDAVDVFYDATTERWRILPLT